MRCVMRSYICLYNKRTHHAYMYATVLVLIVYTGIQNLLDIQAVANTGVRGINDSLA